MDQKEAFIKAICDEPEALDLRLIYADWLQESDPARAAFIRIQCRLAEMEPDDLDRVELEAKQTALQTQHASKWSEEVDQTWGWDYRGGFIDSVSLHSQEEVPSNLESMMRVAPIQRLKLFHSNRSYADLDTSLVEAPWWPRIRHLMLSYRSTLYLPSLTPKIPLPHLRALSLYNVTVDQQIFDALVHILHKQSVEGLDIEGPRVEIDDPLILPIGALSHCTSLTIRQAREGQLWSREWFQSETVPPLQQLAIADCQGTDWAGALATSRWPQALEELTLSHNGIPTAVMGAVLRNPHFRTIRRLNLNSNRVCDDGAVTLSRAPWRSQLTSLFLKSTGIGADGIRALAEPEDMQLRTLDLSSNALGDKGAQILARSSILASVGRLYLRSNAITDKGAEALAFSPYLKNLKVLDLGKNRIKETGLRRLAEAPNLRGLVTFDLRSNKCGDHAVRQFAQALKWKRLRNLILHGNRVEDGGCKALAGCAALSSLFVLGLQGNQIREGGAKLLTSSQYLNQGARLHIEDNGLGAKGSQMIQAFNRRHISGLALD